MAPGAWPREGTFPRRLGEDLVAEADMVSGSPKIGGTSKRSAFSSARYLAKQLYDG
jgi:hypothetical protein